MSNSYFIDNNRIEVETQNGDVYVIGFGSPIPYMMEKQSDKFVTRCVNAIFDTYYNGADSIWGPIAREMYIRGLAFLWVFPNKDIERERIGNRIKEIRSELNIDAKELAQRIGIDAGNLSRIEKGRVSVGLDILCKIAGALNMKIDFVPQKTINTEIKL